MIDPLFWLGLSILLVAVSLTAVLVAAIPALQELARAAKSVEKLADTLRRELPPTLEAIRLTGLEISDLTDDVSNSVKSAGEVVKQVDRSVSGVSKQAQQVQVTTKSVFAGVKAAWKTFSRQPAPRRSVDRLPPSQREAVDFPSSETAPTETQKRKESDSKPSSSQRQSSYPEGSNVPARDRYQQDLEPLDSELDDDQAGI